MARNIQNTKYNTGYRKNLNTSYAGSKSSYVGGSAARKLQTVQAVPEVERRRRQQEKEEQRKQEELRQKHIGRANRINFLYTFAVIGVAVVLYAVCWQYLQLQTSVKTNAAEISDLQSQLTELTAENDEMELKINANIDYEQIYNTAVNELGMVHPDKRQVVTYDAGISEYVKQYQDVPDAE